MREAFAAYEVVMPGWTTNDLYAYLGVAEVVGHCVGRTITHKGPRDCLYAFCLLGVASSAAAEVVGRVYTHWGVRTSIRLRACWVWAAVAAERVGRSMWNFSKPFGDNFHDAF